MTLFEVFNSYKVRRSLSRSTRNQMRTALNSYIQLKGNDLQKLNADDVSEWVNHLENAGRATATIRTYRSSIISLWRYARERGWHDHRPEDVRTVREPYRNAIAFTKEECTALLRAAAAFEGELPWTKDVTAAAYWHAIIRVCWDTGIRRSDLLSGIFPGHTGLQWANLTPRDGGMVLHITQNKTGFPLESVLSSETVSAIQLAKTEETFVFPWRGGMTTFRAQYLRIRDAAKLQNGDAIRRLPFKCLRRASITNVAIRDLHAASQQAGHKPGSAVTVRHYIDWSQISSHRERPEPLDGRRNPRP